MKTGVFCCTSAVILSKAELNKQQAFSLYIEILLQEYKNEHKLFTNRQIGNNVFFNVKYS